MNRDQFMHFFGEKSEKTFAKRSNLPSSESRVRQSESEQAVRPRCASERRPWKHSSVPNSEVFFEPINAPDCRKKLSFQFGDFDGKGSSGLQPEPVHGKNEGLCSNSEGSSKLHPELTHEKDGGLFKVFSFITETESFLSLYTLLIELILVFP